MPSQINPATINPNFPVPGVNQSSQGFRTNFLSIQNNFSETVSEMNDLINKVIVSAPLTYGTPTNINDFGGMLNSNLAIYDYALSVFNNGNISTSGSPILDFSNAAVQQYNLTTANTTQTCSIQNFPDLGYSEMILDITASSVPQNINLSALTAGSAVFTNGNSGLAGFNANTSVFTITKANVPYILTLGSLDGLNWILSERGSTAVAERYTPANIGAPGDTTGMLSFDSGNIYVCTNNWDGVTPIWKYSPLLTF